MKQKLKQFFCNHKWKHEHKFHPWRTEFTCKKCGKVDIWL